MALKISVVDYSLDIWPIGEERPVNGFIYVRLSFEEASLVGRC